ncbi:MULTISPECIES: acetyl/propionyl/methylcrotonyl-CoA carboxylase subunit alpha [unclassified Caballeronia]|uniref:acetyl/propionyl/methylcrotonyl-CoA carboxylase subunit alpha n=1 Tax=unclassified Caballeronia TaxID=2646786 RepID=UPI002864562B|nr:MULTISPECIES: acetyl/propionyl/methylcrotonyl-CoA carboxylase subunit alpha [unclassified Caballeronia]MDR5739808.1 acetyl/propionyl/methylcrotonyl-CoA carboxylase subunit alpha [Caballeronia sp. LZ016]MDR5808272.1 acetyl/propionyl/methylcrotonyl-CoA carboxylase subunit alpha [Caballeronia sp. LZ019]
MFNKILIANRGEIACRVAATAKRLNVGSVAVYSDADAKAKHVDVCDEAVHVGGSAASESYLRIERIVEAAKRTGAQAVHPGYGFLSENEAFANACEETGLVFIGPPVEAIRAMGSKAAAKALMQSASVPLVPGYHGDDQSPDLLQREADRIGYPVLLKASAGGGGKGMRVVERSEDFTQALASCKREAASSFGNDRVLIEKYLLRPRHVEVQVFADKHGNAVYLFDRDCSVQRRHQKVLEEAPAPGLSDETRRAMGEAAVAAARAVNYVGAGTVEFIMTQDGQFYFMEMNTRLQVEHPVTEMVTGLDLVEWQLRVAAGEPLPLQQHDLRVDGHAIEARVYAENPSRGFLPSTGTLRHLALPDAVEFGIDGHVRIDSGVREGDAITPFYDPMIAKLIVHGRDRRDALARMARALAQCEIVGLHTNVEFLQRIVKSEPFSGGELDTGLIERHHDALFAASPVSRDKALALACAALLTREGGEAHGHSPWDALSHWRMSGGYSQDLNWRAAASDETLKAVFTKNGEKRLQLSGESARFDWSHRGETAFSVQLDDALIKGHVFIDGDVFHVFLEGAAFAFEWQNLMAHAGDAEHEGRLTAPMPGKVIAVLVQPGASVEKGAPLIVMEAMKMEHTIVAPATGKIGEILFDVGDQVTDGSQLLVLETEGN